MGPASPSHTPPSSCHGRRAPVQSRRVFKRWVLILSSPHPALGCLQGLVRQLEGPWRGRLVPPLPGDRPTPSPFTGSG